MLKNETSRRHTAKQTSVTCTNFFFLMRINKNTRAQYEKAETDDVIRALGISLLVVEFASFALKTNFVCDNGSNSFDLSNNRNSYFCTVIAHNDPNLGRTNIPFHT